MRKIKNGPYKSYFCPHWTYKKIKKNFASIFYYFIAVQIKLWMENSCEGNFNINEEQISLIQILKNIYSSHIFFILFIFFMIQTNPNHFYSVFFFLKKKKALILFFF